MGLAGMLTVALIVTADESAAGLGVDGLRSIVALVPAAEQDHPDAASPVNQVSSIPLFGGLVAIVRDFAPSIFGVSTGAPSTEQPAGPSSQPSSPSSPAQPAVSPAPAVQPPVATAPTPAPTTAPTPAPTGPAASPTP